MQPQHRIHPFGRRHRGFLPRLRAWRRRLRERRELMRLTDRDLRDLGLTRIEADAEARRPLWRA